MSAIFLFFQPPGSSPVCYVFSSIMAATSANSLRSLGYISSGPIGHVCSSSSGGYGPDLWLQVERLCSSSPFLGAHPLRKCGGKKGGLWSLRRKMLNISAFSLTLFDHVLIFLSRLVSVLPLPLCFFLALYLDQNVSTHLCRSLALLSWFFTLGDWEFLCFMEHDLKDLPALF